MRVWACVCVCVHESAPPESRAQIRHQQHLPSCGPGHSACPSTGESEHITVHCDTIVTSPAHRYTNTAEHNTQPTFKNSVAFSAVGGPSREDAAGGIATGPMIRLPRALDQPRALVGGAATNICIHEAKTSGSPGKRIRSMLTFLQMFLSHIQYRTFCHPNTCDYWRHVVLAARGPSGCEPAVVVVLTWTCCAQSDHVQSRNSRSGHGGTSCSTHTAVAMRFR